MIVICFFFPLSPLPQTSKRAWLSLCFFNYCDWVVEHRYLWASFNQTEGLLASVFCKNPITLWDEERMQKKRSIPHYRNVNVFSIFAYLLIKCVRCVSPPASLPKFKTRKVRCAHSVFLAIGLLKVGSALPSLDYSGAVFAVVLCACSVIGGLCLLPPISPSTAFLKIRSRRNQGCKRKKMPNCAIS